MRNAKISLSNKLNHLFLNQMALDYTSVFGASVVTSGFLVAVGCSVAAGLAHATFFQNLTSTRAGASPGDLIVYSIFN